MKFRHFSASLLSAALAMVMTGCSEGKYSKNDNGITVNLTPATENGVRKVRLQVLGDKIIRVSATPDKKFANDGSLVVVPQENKTQFTVEEADSAISVITSEVRATVSLASGDVKFYDKDGRLIVSEADGGREFFAHRGRGHQRLHRAPGIRISERRGGHLRTRSASERRIQLQGTQRRTFPI